MVQLDKDLYTDAAHAAFQDHIKQLADNVIVKHAILDPEIWPAKILSNGDINAYNPRGGPDVCLGRLTLEVPIFRGRCPKDHIVLMD